MLHIGEAWTRHIVWSQYQWQASQPMKWSSSDVVEMTYVSLWPCWIIRETGRILSISKFKIAAIVLSHLRHGIKEVIAAAAATVLPPSPSAPLLLVFLWPDFLEFSMLGHASQGNTYGETEWSLETKNWGEQLSWVYLENYHQKGWEIITLTIAINATYVNVHNSPMSCSDST